MKPEQAEIARLNREVTKLKAERDILKKSRGLTLSGGRRIRASQSAGEPAVATVTFDRNTFRFSARAASQTVCSHYLSRSARFI
jgi:hypothetical protein